MILNVTQITKVSKVTKIFKYLLISSLSISTLAEANQAYQVYRYISPDGRLVFSTQIKKQPYIKLHQTPEGWVPENELPENKLKAQASPKQNHSRDKYSTDIRRAANRYRLPYYLLHAIITVESSYNNNALSPAGAQGLMQLMPATAERFGVTNPYDSQENIDGGSRYLSYLLRLFNGNLRLALAAYNAGENAVIRHGNRIPPYKETQHYVEKVLKTYRKYRFYSPPY